MTTARRLAEPAAFWLLALAQLIPVWSYRYLPTQDGPSHLNNAQIIRDLHSPEAGYDRVFEVRLDFLPNLTSHLLLAGLMYVAPPLVAEKLLVTAYVLGFAGAYRYFLGGFGDDHRPLSWAGLLFVFNRCFWMGFYNFCLSLVLLWLILGFVVRRLGTLNAGGALALLLLFTAAYFTHLAGFLMALAGAVLATIVAPPRRPATIGLVVLAALPACCLAMSYFEETGFARSASAMRVVRDPLDRLAGRWREAEVEHDLGDLEGQVFGYQAGSKVPLGTVVGAYLLVLTALTIAIPPGRRPERPAPPGPLFPAAFGVLLLAAYLLVPDHLGADSRGLPNGGFLKPRLAILPALFWLACVREPNVPVLRPLLRAGIAVAVGVNLALATGAVRDGNRELSRYTAGLEAAGRGQRLRGPQFAPWPSPWANPLLHAADYYCLGTANVNLDNYEAGTPHFPVKYRADRGGRGRFDADVRIVWHGGSGDQPGWVEVFRQGPLVIYRRTAAPAGRP